jgi:hypothetical protein
MSVCEVVISRAGVITHVGTFFSKITESIESLYCLVVFIEFGLVYFDHVCTNLTQHALLPSKQYESAGFRSLEWSMFVLC